MNTYTNTASKYDILYRGWNGEISFYRKQIMINKSVLDIGCGTGRVTLKLAEYSLNCNFDCVDKSKEMLNEFQKKIDEDISITNFTKRIQIINEDMEKYSTSKKYDLIIYSGQSIQCLGRDKIEEQLIKSKGMLKKHGRIIVSFFVIDKMSQSMGVQEQFNGMAYHKDGFYIGINDKYEFLEDVMKYQLCIRHYNTKGILVEILRDNFEVANVDYEYLSNLHERIGLKKVGMYSDYCSRKNFSKSIDCIIVLKN